MGALLSTSKNPAEIFLDDVTSLCTASFYRLLSESFSRHLHGLVKEIDTIIQEWVERNRDAAASERYAQDNDHDRAFEANRHSIIQHLREREAERNAFTRIFPGWKEDRQTVIKQLNELADALDADHSLANQFNAAASFSQFSSALTSVLSYFYPSAKLAADVLASTYGVLRFGTVTTEKYRIKTHMEKAEKLVDSDRRKFMALCYWFTYNDRLMAILRKTIDEGSLKSCFNFFKSFYTRVGTYRDNHSMVRALQIALDKILECLIKNGFSLHYAVPFAAALFKIFLISTVGFLSLESSSAGIYLSYLETTAVCGFAACTTYTAVNDFLTSPAELSLPATAYVGIAILIAAAFFAGAYLDESKSKQAMKLREIVSLLNREMTNIERVYTELLRDM